MSPGLQGEQTGEGPPRGPLLSGPHPAPHLPCQLTTHPRMTPGSCWGRLWPSTSARRSMPGVTTSSATTTWTGPRATEWAQPTCLCWGRTAAPWLPPAPSTPRACMCPAGHRQAPPTPLPPRPESPTWSPNPWPLLGCLHGAAPCCSCCFFLSVKGVLHPSFLWPTRLVVGGPEPGPTKGWALPRGCPDWGTWVGVQMQCQGENGSCGMLEGRH